MFGAAGGLSGELHRLVGSADPEPRSQTNTSRLSGSSRRLTSLARGLTAPSSTHVSALVPPSGTGAMVAPQAAKISSVPLDEWRRPLPQLHRLISTLALGCPRHGGEAPHVYRYSRIHGWALTGDPRGAVEAAVPTQHFHIDCIPPFAPVAPWSINAPGMMCEEALLSGPRPPVPLAELALRGGASPKDPPHFCAAGSALDLSLRELRYLKERETHIGAADLGRDFAEARDVVGVAGSVCSARGDKSPRPTLAHRETCCSASGGDASMCLLDVECFLPPAYVSSRGASETLVWLPEPTSACYSRRHEDDCGSVRISPQLSVSSWCVISASCPVSAVATPSRGGERTQELPSAPTSAGSSFAILEIPSCAELETLATATGPGGASCGSERTPKGFVPFPDLASDEWPSSGEGDADRGDLEASVGSTCVVTLGIVLGPCGEGGEGREADDGLWRAVFTDEEGGDEAMAHDLPREPCAPSSSCHSLPPECGVAYSCGCCMTPQLLLSQAVKALLHSHCAVLNCFTSNVKVFLSQVPVEAVVGLVLVDVVTHVFDAVLSRRTVL